VSPQIAGRSKIKCTSLISTTPLSLLLRTKNGFSISTSQELLSEKTLELCATKFRVEFFLGTAAKVYD